MNYVQMLEKVKEEVIAFFEAHENPALAYHNINHTKMVVSRAGQIARHYQLNDHDFFVVTAAAWFHDAGYYITGANGHELSSATMAEKFLISAGAGDLTVQEVRQCIVATALPQNPKNLPEQIVCDADLFHIGTSEFTACNKLMRKEAELVTSEKISKADWRKSTITLLESHHYHTDYVRNLLTDKKAENLMALKEKEKATTPVIATNTTEPTKITTAPLPVIEPEIAAKKQKEDKPSRGIETMFRISSGNHQRLSDMADNKAHIMITTTSIILSVLLSLLLRKLEDYPNLIFPTIMLLIVCVITLVFSILATRPTLPKGTFTDQDITAKKVNLLFFGNYYRMEYEAYSKGMQLMMNDREFLYGSLTRDLYAQGKVLGRKYRLLRIGYNVFMFGIIASVLAFVLSIFFFK